MGVQCEFRYHHSGSNIITFIGSAGSELNANACDGNRSFSGNTRNMSQPESRFLEGAIVANCSSDIISFFLTV